MAEQQADCWDSPDEGEGNLEMEGNKDSEGDQFSWAPDLVCLSFVILGVTLELGGQAEEEDGLK